MLDELDCSRRGHRAHAGDDRDPPGRGAQIKAFNGWDTLTFAGIALGAEASVWGVAGIVPEQAVALWDTLAVKGDLVAAREQWRDLWALSSYLESISYVSGVKTALEILGHPVGPTRAPVQPLSAEQRAGLAAVLEPFMPKEA